MSLSPLVVAALSKVNFTGGLPVSKDWTPCIVFIVLYTILLFPFVWRCASRQHRSSILIRPGIFIALRLAFFSIRMVMIKKGMNKGLLVSDLFLILVGFPFLIEPAIAMYNRLIKIVTPRFPKERAWEDWFCLVLRLGYWGAILSGSVAAGFMEGAFSHPSYVAKIKPIRQACYAFCLVTIGLLLIAIVISAIALRLPVRQTAFVLLICSLLTVASCYRLANGESVNVTDWVRTKEAFWIFQVTTEWLVTAMVLAVSLPKWFPLTELTIESISDASLVDESSVPTLFETSQSTIDLDLEKGLDATKDSPK